MPFDFTVTIEKPFFVDPPQGFLQPGASITLQATFVPPNAAPFSATAVIQAGGISRPVFLSGTFEHIVASVVFVIGFLSW